MNLEIKTDTTRSLPNALFMSLSLSLFLGSMSNLQAQDISADPLFGSITLESGFDADPFVIDIAPGGSRTVDHLGDECLGYITADQPDFRLNYTADSNTLGVFADSDADTTLIISDPRGNWHCSDDATFLEDTNPGIMFNTPIDGEYNIWVGVYSSSEADSDVALAITEMDEAFWSSLIVSPEDLVSVADIGDISFGDNQSSWANDGECDDPRFTGSGMAGSTNEEDRLHDATDCRTLYQTGSISLIGALEQASYPQGIGRIIRGTLDGNDLSRSNGSLVDSIELAGQIGNSVTVELRSGDFNPAIILRKADGETVEGLELSDSSSHSLISFVLADDDAYEIWVSSDSSGETGSYTLTIETTP